MIRNTENIKMLQYTMVHDQAIFHLAILFKASNMQFGPSNMSIHTTQHEVV